jgi:HlyD family secretion protein
VDMRVGQKARIYVDALPDTFFAGTVTEIGNTAKRSALSTVEGQTNFEIKVVFDEDVPEVRPGMNADVEVETGTHARTLGVPIQAVVVRTQSELDRAAHKPAARVKKPKTTNSLDLAGDEDTVGRKEKEVTGVFVASKEGTVKFVPVRTGIAGESSIEVVGAVKAGDLVVAGPYKALRDLKPGARVKRETAAAGRGRK